ncbi:hypothetical protein BDZ97DRAFT_1913870 [Flammula alnicola]|nr:hypothetical protein BDZ97DRAFT_1913870 [Flammula alnicola]
MGQRHQVYIIARVVPHGNPDKPNYRCIGALHHQWCYGSLPLKAATRFLTLMKQKDNAEIIREEVRALNGLYGSTMREVPVIPNTPCPFTSFLLSSAWTTDLSEPDNMYGSNTMRLPAKVGTLEGDNNDGITVIDVTDPETPSYCFVFLDERKPISATQYIRTYYPETEDMEEVVDLKAIEASGTELNEAQRNWLHEQTVVSTFRGFDSIPLVSIHKLAEAWPREYKAPRDSAPGETVVEAADELPSLADLTLGPALELALRNDDNAGTEQLERLLFLPDKARKIMDTLRNQSPMPDAGVSLLAKLLNAEVKDNKVINLSGFHLTGAQIIAVLPQDGDVEVLELSHNDQVKVDTVEKVITMYPSLRRLVLLKTGVTDDDVVALLQNKPELFRHIEAFIHPVFMKEPAESKIPSAFTHVFFHRSMSVGGPTSVSLPYFTSGQVAQALIDYLSPLASEYPYQFLESLSLGFPQGPLMAAYASQIRREGQPWGERVVSIVPNLTFPVKALQDSQAWNFVFAEKSKFLYAFVRYNSEANGQYTKECKEVKSRMKDEENPLTKEEVKAKLKIVAQAYASRIYQMYDVRDFFKQLELAGRAPPAPELLTPLFDLFSKLGSKEDYGAMQLMTSGELVKHLETESIHQCMYNSMKGSGQLPYM